MSEIKKPEVPWVLPPLTQPVSRYLSVADVVKSSTASRYNIKNIPNRVELTNAMYLGLNVYDPIKDRFPEATYNSFFRCNELNVKVGGSPGSYHRYAAALDVDSPGNVLNRAIFELVMKTLPYNELIWEYGTLKVPDWVHVGLLKGFQKRAIKHIFYDGKGIKKTQVLSVDEAKARFGYI